MNSFKDFDCKFQNTFFAEQVSVTTSELYRFIKTYSYADVVFLVSRSFEKALKINRILLIFLDLLCTRGSQYFQSRDFYNTAI